MEGSEVKVKAKSKVLLDLSQTSTSGGKTKSEFGKKSLSRMKFRKQSFGFSAVPSLAGQVRRRSSQSGLEFKRPMMIYLPTFQMEPRVKFNVEEVTKVINSILDEMYTDTKYSVVDSPGVTMRIADEVMRKVKGLNFNRYRIISVVTMAQKRAQCYSNAVAFLWDHMFDNLVDINREENTSFIQVTVFGVYLD